MWKPSSKAFIREGAGDETNDTIGVSDERLRDESDLFLGMAGILYHKHFINIEQLFL